MGKKVTKLDIREMYGSWINFELYYDDPEPAVKRAWQDAERAVRSKEKQYIPRFLFLFGAKNFWKAACRTAVGGSRVRLGRWEITASGADGMRVTWIDEYGNSLGMFDYKPDCVIEDGLDDVPNYLFKAEIPQEVCPYRYLLIMPPTPGRAKTAQGGLICHLHFQFADKKEGLVKKNGMLRHKWWHATVCDANGSVLQRCNILRALHRLPVWTELPEELQT